MTALAAQPGTPVQPAAEPSVWRSIWVSLSAVVVKELRWRMRGRRAFVIVTIYVTLIALLVFFVQRNFEQAVNDQIEFGGGSFLGASVSAVVGQSIFSAILVIQTLLTVVVAPALTSGAISVEREKQTLELLITTPVSTLGMVVGKLISSLAYVVLLILASIPLMSIVFAFGGIAPDDIVRAYVLLFAVALGTGSIGLFLSALLKRSQVATALSYVTMFVLTVVLLIAHTYMVVSSVVVENGTVSQRAPSDVLLWLNPFVANVDVMCTAIPDSYGGTCAYITLVTGTELDPNQPPRDAFWPRSALAFGGLAVVLTLATTQLIAPSRRLRRLPPPAGPPDSTPGT